MKEEYLWNKTGEDEEIRQLEETLAAFRHRPGEAPRIYFEFQPAPVAAAGWKLFSLRLALAFSAVTVAAVGAWGVMQRSLRALEYETVFVSMPAEPEPAFAEAGSDKSFMAQPAATIPDTAPTARLSRESRSAMKTVNKAAKQAPIRKPQRPLLTAEEQYAYDEVRRALSISSEKLRIVKDTINGYEPIGRDDVR